jgi:hypothetical protein
VRHSASSIEPFPEKGPYELGGIRTRDSRISFCHLAFAINTLLRSDKSFTPRDRERSARPVLYQAELRAHRISLFLFIRTLINKTADAYKGEK